MSVTWTGLGRLLVVGFLVSTAGCGRQPCFEGALEVELMAVEFDADMCDFEVFSEGTHFLMRTTDKRSKKYREPRCRVQQAIYVELPEGAKLAGRSRETVVAKGSPIAELEALTFAKEGCGHHLQGVLSIDTRYDDFEDAYRGHRKGDDKAFYVTFDDRGVGECPEFGVALDVPKSCTMTHRLNVSQLDFP